MSLNPRRVYELSFLFKRSEPSTKSGLVFFLNRTGGINASAGVINLDFPQHPGNYTVSEWTHDMNKEKLPPSMANRYTDEQCKQEQIAMYREAGEVGVHRYSLPGRGMSPARYTSGSGCSST